jgi:hypothetical protein
MWFQPRCKGLHCPGCEVEGEIPIMPILIVVALFIVLSVIADAARQAIASTHVLLTDIIDGVLIFSLSVIGTILIALVIWLASHAGRIMWKYRGNYGLREPGIPITILPPNGMYMTGYDNEIEFVDTKEVNGVHVPMAINPPPAYDANKIFIDDLLTDVEVPVRVKEKSKYSLRRD